MKWKRTSVQLNGKLSRKSFLRLGLPRISINRALTIGYRDADAMRVTKLRLPVRYAAVVRPFVRRSVRSYIRRLSMAPRKRARYVTRRVRARPSQGDGVPRRRKSALVHRL